LRIAPGSGDASTWPAVRSKARGEFPVAQGREFAGPAEGSQCGRAVNSRIAAANRGNRRLTGDAMPRRLRHPSAKAISPAGSGLDPLSPSKDPWAWGHGSPSSINTLTSPFMPDGRELPRCHWTRKFSTTDRTHAAARGRLRPRNWSDLGSLVLTIADARLAVLALTSRRRVLPPGVGVSSSDWSVGMSAY
jgi:hypothetical protein